MKPAAHALFAVLSTSILFLGGCQPAPAIPDPALQATVENFAATVTARANESGGSRDDLQATQAAATQQSRLAVATQTAQATRQSADLQATQSAAAPVQAELPLYDVDPASGSVAWLHPPVEIKLDAFRSADMANDYPTIPARDFVMAADITWETEYGASGCGFLLRSDGEMQNTNGYLVILSRNSNGHLYFTALADGKPANYRNYYTNRLDPAFDWQNGSTNRLAVAALGPLLRIYSNYTLIGEVDTTQPPPPAPDLPPAPKKPELPAGHVVNNLKDEVSVAYQAQMEQYRQDLEEYKELTAEIKSQHAAALAAFLETDTAYAEGFVGMVAFAYSGAVTCRFDNAWLWLVGE